MYIIMFSSKSVLGNLVQGIKGQTQSLTIENAFLWKIVNWFFLSYQRPYNQKYKEELVFLLISGNCLIDLN